MKGDVDIGWYDLHVTEGCVEVPDMSVINGIPPCEVNLLRAHDPAFHVSKRYAVSEASLYVFRT